VHFRGDFWNIEAAEQASNHEAIYSNWVGEEKIED
jgi:hypothetical protein